MFTWNTSKGCQKKDAWLGCHQKLTTLLNKNNFPVNFYLDGILKYLQVFFARINKQIEVDLKESVRLKKLCYQNSFEFTKQV